MWNLGAKAEGRFGGFREIRPSLEKAGEQRTATPCSRASHLSINMRAHGGLERLVSKFHYRNLMVAENNMRGAVDKSLRKILQCIGGPNTRGSTLTVLLQNAQHEKRGVSVTNKAEAAIVKSIVNPLFLHGACSTLPTNKAPGTRCTILITTPYQEQAQLIRLMVGQQLAPLFAVKELPTTARLAIRYMATTARNARFPRAKSGTLRTRSIPVMPAGNRTKH